MAITREEQYRAPADKIAGTYIQPPRGIILHGSRSSRSVSLAEEYRGTAAWAISNPGGLCWAVTVGPNIYAPHLTAREWGWHAREHSDEYLGCEFAQPTVNHAITADQIATFVEWYLRDVQPMWPRLTLATDDQMPMHSELPAGIRDGKTDAFPKGDVRAHELRQRIRAELARRQGTRFRVLPGMLAAMRRNKDEPASDEVELRPGYTIATGRKGTYIWSEATDFVTFTPRV